MGERVGRYLGRGFDGCGMMIGNTGRYEGELGSRNERGL